MADELWNYLKIMMRAETKTIIFLDMKIECNILNSIYKLSLIVNHEEADISLFYENRLFYRTFVKAKYYKKLSLVILYNEEIGENIPVLIDNNVYVAEIMWNKDRYKNVTIYPAKEMYRYIEPSWLGMTWKLKLDESNIAPLHSKDTEVLGLKKFIVRKYVDARLINNGLMNFEDMINYSITFSAPEEYIHEYMDALNMEKIFYDLKYLEEAQYQLYNVKPEKFRWITFLHDLHFHFIDGDYEASIVFNLNPDISIEDIEPYRNYFIGLAGEYMDLACSPSFDIKDAYAKISMIGMGPKLQVTFYK